MKILCTLALTIMTSFIVGCAGVGTLKPGASQAEVRAAWGTPTVAKKTTTGERWTYSTAPEGNRVFLLEFDSRDALSQTVHVHDFRRPCRCW